MGSQHTLNIKGNSISILLSCWFVGRAMRTSCFCGFCLISIGVLPHSKFLCQLENSFPLDQRIWGDLAHTQEDLQRIWGNSDLEDLGGSPLELDLQLTGLRSQTFLLQRRLPLVEMSATHTVIIIIIIITIIMSIRANSVRNNVSIRLLVSASWWSKHFWKCMLLRPSHSHDHKSYFCHCILVMGWMIDTCITGGRRRNCKTISRSQQHTFKNTLCCIKPHRAFLLELFTTTLLLNQITFLCWDLILLVGAYTYKY